MEFVVRDIDLTKENELLVKPNSQKGKKGFIKAKNPRTELIVVKISKKHKDFVRKYIKLTGRTYSEVVMEGLACVTGYDGTNGKVILEDIRFFMKQRTSQ
jgi:hypothetical protein